MSLRFTIRDVLWLMVVALAARWACGQQEVPAWTLKLRYGGGTPSDAGPLGHCTATFASNGNVKIESKGRRGVAGPSDVVVYQTESLSRERMQAIFAAADAALKEKPFKRRGANERSKAIRQHN